MLASFALKPVGVIRSVPCRAWSNLLFAFGNLHCQGSHGHGKSWNLKPSWKVLERSWIFVLFQEVMDNCYFKEKVMGFCRNHQFSHEIYFIYIYIFIYILNIYNFAFGNLHCICACGTIVMACGGITTADSDRSFRKVVCSIPVQGQNPDSLRRTVLYNGIT